MSCSPFQRALWFGFSLSSFQPFLCRSFRVMLPLILDIADDPRKIPCSKAHYSVTCLPVQQVAIGDSMVDVMGAGSLHLPDPVTDQQRWRDAHDQVHVVLNATNCVEVQSGCSERAVLQESMQMLVYRIYQDGRVVFCVPHEMKVDLRIDVSRHGSSRRLKPFDKPVETGSLWIYLEMRVTSRKTAGLY